MSKADQGSSRSLGTPSFSSANVAELLDRPGVHDLSRMLGARDLRVLLVVLEPAGCWQPPSDHRGPSGIALLRGGPIRLRHGEQATQVLDRSEQIARPRTAVHEVMNLETTTASFLVAGRLQAGGE